MVTFLSALAAVEADKGAAELPCRSLAHKDSLDEETAKTLTQGNFLERAAGAKHAIPVST